MLVTQINTGINNIYHSITPQLSKKNAAFAKGLAYSAAGSVTSVATLASMCLFGYFGQSPLTPCPTFVCSLVENIIIVSVAKTTFECFQSAFKEFTISANA